jgi:hypothetical protein
MTPAQAAARRVATVDPSKALKQRTILSGRSHHGQILTANPWREKDATPKYATRAKIVLAAAAILWSHLSAGGRCDAVTGT